MADLQGLGAAGTGRGCTGDGAFADQSGRQSVLAAAVCRKALPERLHRRHRPLRGTAVRALLPLCLLSQAGGEPGGFALGAGALAVVVPAIAALVDAADRVLRERR